jgi:hypothetical protein
MIKIYHTLPLAESARFSDVPENNQIPDTFCILTTSTIARDSAIVFAVPQPVYVQAGSFNGHASALVDI